RPAAHAHAHAHAHVRDSFGSKRPTPNTQRRTPNVQLKKTADKGHREENRGQSLVSRNIYGPCTGKFMLRAATANSASWVRNVISIPPISRNRNAVARCKASSVPRAVGNDWDARSRIGWLIVTKSMVSKTACARLISSATF